MTRGLTDGDKTKQKQGDALLSVHEENACALLRRLAAEARKKMIAPK